MKLSQFDKKVIIFDFDETLVTMELDWNIYMGQLIEEMSKLDSKIAEKYSPDKLDHNLSNEMIIKHGSRARDIDIKISEDFEMNHLKSYSVHQEFFDIIEELHNDKIFYIWSTNTTKRIQTILEEIDRAELFKDIVSKNKVELTKPYPDGFYIIDEVEKLQRKDYMFIGNSQETDKLAAASSGLEFVLV